MAWWHVGTFVADLAAHPAIGLGSLQGTVVDQESGALDQFFDNRAAIPAHCECVEVPITFGTQDHTAMASGVFMLYMTSRS